ncbi:conserved hypothetical protein [Candidatus Sulfopaludibacter sp. SbA4]|nr:conserved hypothetical protein [Candidatus Sulfopaludibacter sp. SbA4]
MVAGAGTVEMNSMGVEDKYLDVLQNMEFAIVTEFRRERSVLDIDVTDAVAALIAFYEAEIRERRPSPLRIGERSRKIFDAVKKVCEWRMGRAPAVENPGKPITPEEVVICLKRIRKSIDLWTKEGGRQGYLSFVSQYIV